MADLYVATIKYTQNIYYGDEIIPRESSECSLCRSQALCEAWRSSMSSFGYETLVLMTDASPEVHKQKSYHK